jgi:predicted metal-binding protein
MTEPTAFLHVCTTCRVGVEPVEAMPVPGALLHARLAALLAMRPDAPVRLLAVKCLSNCDHGCAAAIASPGKWSYLLGGLDLDRASDLLEYAAIYAASGSGVVMPSKRPASLAAMVCGRIPPLAATEVQPA